MADSFLQPDYEQRLHDVNRCDYYGRIQNKII